MLKFFLTLLLVFSTFLIEAISWKGNAGDNFSVEIEISTTTLNIDQTLDLTIHFNYPDGYNVNLDKVRADLLQYSGLTEPPFSLVSEKIEGKTLFIRLEPMLAGIHFLSLYDIEFNHKDSEKHPPVVIFSNIFQIETILPPAEKNFNGWIYPLLSLSKRYPVTITPDNRIALLENPLLLEKEEQKNESIIQQKTFPWLKMAGVFLFFYSLIHSLDAASKAQPWHTKTTNHFECCQQGIAKTGKFGTAKSS